MTHTGTPRRTAIPLVVFLAAAASLAAAAERRVDHRFAAPNLPTLIGTPLTGQHALVAMDGSLLYADGARLSVAPIGDLALPPNAPSAQKLLQSGLPIIVTARESEKVALELTAFAAPSPAMECLRVVVRNKTAAALNPVLRIKADRAQGLLPGGQAGFIRDGKLFAVVELRDGKGKVIGGEQPKRSVFRRTGGKDLPAWGHPKVPCDKGFTNIVAGMAEPATYQLQVERGKKYVVAVGLCESHWKAPGNRILDLLIEGQKVATVDPIKPPYGTDVHFVLTFPAADRDGDGWISVTSVANAASPDVNSIVNVIWLFEESVARGLGPADILSGRATAQAHGYVDCGGTADAPGATTLDYQVELAANGSATLWLKRPVAPTEPADAAKLAALDPAALLAGVEPLWRGALKDAAMVGPSDPAAELLQMSLVNLLLLGTRKADGITFQAGAFAPPLSPEGAARCALALDRVGLHAAAAETLAALIGRRGDERLWSGQADATGQVLWALVSHYDQTHDKKWLADNYRAIFSAAEALAEARQVTQWISHNDAANYHGLLPIAAWREFPADHWYVRDFWAWQGLRCAARAAKALEKAGEATWLEDALADYSECLRRSIAQSHASGPAAGCLPAAPGDTPFWTFAGCVAALYPAQALPAADPLIAASFRRLAAAGIEGLPGGLDGASPVVDIPLACDYALARLARGDVDAALAALTAIANASSSTGTLPERANLRARQADGFAPSAAAAAGYILLFREVVAQPPK